MSMGATQFISEFRLTGAPLSIGVKVDGYLFATQGFIAPFGAGPILQDANGNYWKVGVDTDGALTTTPASVP
jgi:hypothetical protein